VLKADWFDPEINPKLADFCRHYGMHVVPCRPATPQHNESYRSIDDKKLHPSEHARFLPTRPSAGLKQLFRLLNRTQSYVRSDSNAGIPINLFDIEDRGGNHFGALQTNAVFHELLLTVQDQPAILSHALTPPPKSSAVFGSIVASPHLAALGLRLLVRYPAGIGVVGPE
jgi:hypothetical protein